MSHIADETYDVYAEPRHRARKPHTCGACGETIPVGVIYTRVFVLFDGRKETIKRCSRCQRIHEHLRTIDPWRETWPDERLACGATYEDEWGEEPPPEIAALAFALPGDSGGET